MRLFISYAHVDKSLVKKQIVDILEAGGHTAWFDEQLIVGQDWKQQLSDAIRKSDALVYAMTPDSIASEWCQWEYVEAARLGKPVVPVLLKPTKLPVHIRSIQYVDFSNGLNGDAVARLMRGLHVLSLEDVPSVPINPQGTPPQFAEADIPHIQDPKIREKIMSENKNSIVRDFGIIVGIFTIIGAIAAMIDILPTEDSPTPPPITQVVTRTPVMTPIPTKIATDNLLLNSDFSRGIINWNIPGACSETLDGQIKTMQIEEALNGDEVCGPFNWSTIYQDVDISQVGTNQFSVSARIRWENVAEGHVKVEWYDANGDRILDENGSGFVLIAGLYTGTNLDWQVIRKTITAPENAVRARIMVLHGREVGNGPAVPGSTMYVDEICFAPSSDGSEAC